MNNLFEAVDNLSNLVESQDTVAEESFGKWRLTVQPSNYNNDKLTVSFYDLSQDSEKFPGGQQTPGTYYVDTLFGDSWGPSIRDMECLRIDNEVPAWTVEHDDLVKIADWLEQFRSENQMNENATEQYWDAKEIAREGFTALLKFNFGSDVNGNNYIITNDNNEIKRFRANSDEDAIKSFDKYNHLEEKKKLSDFDQLVQDIYDFYSEWDPYGLDYDEEIDLDSIRKALSDPDDDTNVLYDIQEIAKELEDDPELKAKANSIISRLQMNEAEESKEDKPAPRFNVGDKVTYDGVPAEIIKVEYHPDYGYDYCIEQGEGFKSSSRTIWIGDPEYLVKVEEITEDEGEVPSYTVYTIAQVGPNEYQTSEYDTVYDAEQAADMVAELRAQGLNADYKINPPESIFEPKPEDWDDINHWYNDDPREEWDKKVNESDKSEKWMSDEDIEWLKKQGHEEKLEALVNSKFFTPTGDVEEDQIDLNNLASGYFYDDAGFYNEQIDSLCTKWAHDKAIEINKKDESCKLKEDENELKSLLRARIDKDLEEFKKNNPGKSDYFVKNNYNADDIVNAFNEEYGTNFSWIMSEDHYHLPYVAIVNNTSDNLKALYNKLMSDGEINSPAGNKITMRDGIARRSNAYDFGNDDCKSFKMSNGEEAFAEWIKGIDKVPVRIDRS